LTKWYGWQPEKILPTLATAEVSDLIYSDCDL
jgi:hypothetical protein